jgi:tetratricopeptide (TPR) repeat protein
VSVLDLGQALVAEEVARVRVERWSGVLALAQGEVAKGLYFLDGEIAFAASTVEEDRLGACLFRVGKITEGQFRAAMRECEATGRPLGQAFVELGHLTPDELSAAVTAQVERIVLSVLRWTTGTLRRDPMDRPLPADLALDLNTHRMLLLGTRQFPDVGRLERALGAPERRLRRVSPWPFDYETVPPSAAERAVLALCLRSVALGDLLALPHPRPQLVRAIYALLAGGLLETAPARVPAPTPLAPPEPARRAPPAPELRPVQVEADLTPSPPPPRTAEEAERAARTFLERGQRRLAIEALEEAIQRYPEARSPARLLAMTLGRESAFRPEVEKRFLGLLETAPRDAELRYALASYYRRTGFAARAMLQLRLVLSADPGHAAAWRDLGELEAGETRRRPDRS